MNLNRREFLKASSAAFVGTVGCRSFVGDGAYSVSILGDTHFDAAPSSRYHAKWIPHDADDLKWRKVEFARNAEMWSDRLPRLVAAAAKVRRTDVAFLLQLGDLVQGDCSDTAVQLGMFRDAEAACRKGFGDLPFLTVCGNHDIRNGGALAFDAYYRNLVRRFPLSPNGQERSLSGFWFPQGPDAFILLDFMRPDVNRLNALLDETEGARHTFVALHSPIAPSDTWGSYWFLLGKPEQTEARRTLFNRLLKRHAIVLGGHIHRTQFRRWRKDGGELVEICMNSVWRPQEDRPETLIDRPDQLGSYVRAHPAPMNEEHDGHHQTRTVAEQLALIDEYREGLVDYRQLKAAGHYRLSVGDSGIVLDFFACDALAPTVRWSI